MILTERIEVLVSRTTNINDAYVVVSCDTSGKIDSGDKLLEYLIKAVTKWVQTPEGRPLFEYAADDLNIGDLSSYCREPTLARLLKEEGINNFQIIQPDRCDWNYDTPLVSTNNLPGGDEYWCDIVGMPQNLASTMSNGGPRMRTGA